PGIYISAQSRAAKRWRNIGIRIEDDVAVTHDGPDVLSRGLAKEPDEIEDLMAG
ncbi:MAG TPA: Xaa-Pro aminopeptidase, partial [Woeseiaceae bacterium]|nr:Xaa-Pro aminopeptidase [Woeseiaceae bacterium]